MTMRVKMPKHILLGTNEFADVESPRRSNEQGTLMYSHCLSAWGLAIKACKPQGVFTKNLDSKDYGLNNLHWSRAYLRNENDKEWKMKMENGNGEQKWQWAISMWMSLLLLFVGYEWTKRDGKCMWMKMENMEWNEVNGLLWSMDVMDGCDGDNSIWKFFKCLDLILHQHISSLLLIILLWNKLVS